MSGKRTFFQFYKLKNNLKIYKDANHPHDSQNPKLLDFKSMNRKNEVNA